jgi:glyceraldehyde-3-phosphate dehydrogenase (NAD(P)+) (phosphorylating)
MRKARIRVAVNGYGVIGKRVADAVVAQDDMELVGVADLVSDWRIQVAIQKAYPIFSATDQAYKERWLWNDLTFGLLV